MHIGSPLVNASFEELAELPLSDLTNYRVIVVEDKIYVRKKTGGWLEIYTDQNTENLPIVTSGSANKVVKVNNGETGYELSNVVDDFNVYGNLAVSGGVFLRNLKLEQRAIYYGADGISDISLGPGLLPSTPDGLLFYTTPTETDLTIRLPLSTENQEKVVFIKNTGSESVSLNTKENDIDGFDNSTTTGDTLAVNESRVLVCGQTGYGWLRMAKYTA